MVELNNVKFECVHCGRCCCDPNTLVNVTYLDILKIYNGLNFTLEELLEVLGFYIYTEKVNRKNLLKMIIPPVSTENGLAFLALRKLDSGSCIFYNQKKARCNIYLLRPIFCRTFPFNFEYSNKNPVKKELGIIISYTEKGLEYCKGISKNSPPINRIYWIDLGKKVLDILNKNKIFTKKWNRNVKFHNVQLTAKNYLLTVLKEQLAELNKH